jgi:hypothetical protein
MRAEILDYLQGLNLGSFTVSQEIPWTDGGVPLYLKNLKRVYVDNDNVETVPLFATLDGLNVQQKITTVRVYFANDVKVQPPDYTDAVSQITAVRDLSTLTGVHRREVDITTSIENDNQVTEFEFRYTNIT